MMVILSATNEDGTDNKPSSPSSSSPIPRRKLSVRHVVDKVQKYLKQGIPLYNV